MAGGGLLVLTALCLVQAEVRLEAGGRFETSVGQAPTRTETLPSGQTQDIRDTLVLVAGTPLFNLHWFAGVHDLVATSATRILWRPVPMLSSRPLFLETVDAAHVASLTRRTTLQLRLRGSYGEQDYTSLAQQFANQATLPLAITTLIVEGGGQVAWRASRRTTLSLLFGAIHRRSVNAPSTTVSGSGLPFLLPTEVTVNAAPAWRFALSRVSALQLSIPMADYDVRGAQLRTSEGGALNPYRIGHVNFASAQPQLEMLTGIDRKHQVRLMAGFAYAISFLNASSTSGFIPVAPLALAEWRTRLVRARSNPLQSVVGVGTTWYADPILGVTVQRATAEAGINLELGPAWALGASASFITDVSSPLPAINNGPVPDETIATFNLPIRYRLRNQLMAEIGGRYSGRGPHLDRGFSLPRREIWAYFSIYTLTRPVRRPL